MSLSDQTFFRFLGVLPGGSTAARDEAAVLAASAHLTDRDRKLVRLVARHRVLTTDQLAALRFGNLTTARHRLAVLVRVGLLRRFRPHREIGSAPWHYVLGPIGAALLARKTATRRNGRPRSAPTGRSPWNAPSASGT
jgi:DNA-binding CsgD family transcriptional regulator